MKIMPNYRMFKGLISARYFLALMGSIGLAIIYCLKINMSLTIVTMVNHTAIAKHIPYVHHKIVQNATLMTESCLKQGAGGAVNDAKVYDGPYAWTDSVQGTILSSYFWGYLVSQLPGSQFAEMLSAKWVMFFAVSVNILGAILTPLAARVHYVCVLIVRIFQGIGGGVTFPAMHVLLAHWSPPNELGVMSSIVYTGTGMGTAMSTAIVSSIGDVFGWESVYYVIGIGSLLWLVGWAVFIYDHPEEDPFIEEDEKRYIVSTVPSSMNKRHATVPWKEIIYSLPFQVLLITHMLNNYGWYMILTELPKFMTSVGPLNPHDTTVVLGVSFFFMWLFSMLYSKVSAYLIQRNVINLAWSRKLATFVASFFPMVSFATITYVNCDLLASIFLMLTAVMPSGAMFSGFMTNHIDLAPNYAGTLMAITNTIATLPGICIPLIVGQRLERDSSIYTWRDIFFTVVVCYFFEIVMFTLFSSVQIQPWNSASYEGEGMEGHPLKSSLPTIHEATLDYSSTDNDDRLAADGNVEESGQEEKNLKTEKN